MAGGIITSYLSDPNNEKSGLWQTKNSKGNDQDAVQVVVPTLLQMTQDSINYFTGLTCLYDRYWNGGNANEFYVKNNDKATLPIALLHITKMQEQSSNEVSTKRVVVYEPDNKTLGVAKLSDTIRPSATQSIVDNVVRKPKSYAIEAVVPFVPFARYFNEGISTVYNMIEQTIDLCGGKDSEAAAKVAGGFGAVYEALNYAKRIADVAGQMPDCGGSAYINKNSLEAMADSCRPIVMKTWMGYDYKYIVITGMSIEKKSTEDDVFRASITAQEVPVLTVTEPRRVSNSKAKALNWVAIASSATYKVLSEPIIAFTDVRKASGER